ncbi:MAG: hypothetical protein K2F76_09490, partial [Duncaniella dubosii]|nr:hypothetical protein [Duncaniella dubosii]
SQKVALRNHLRPMLELESGSNDPMAYMLTIILIEAITLGGGLSAGNIAVELILQFGVGGAAGFVMGKLTLWLISAYRRIGRSSGNQEDASQATSMISILMIGCVFFTFAITTALAGNGYLAVYICGIVLGNATLPNHRGISKFIDGMTWLAQIVVFLMLGLLVNPHEMIDVAVVSIMIGIFMILVGRPLSVFVSLAPLRKISTRSKLFISWVGLRSRTNHLRHISCRRKYRRGRTDFQHCVFCHAPFPANTGNDCHSIGKETETNRPGCQGG